MTTDAKCSFAGGCVKREPILKFRVSKFRRGDLTTSWSVRASFPRIALQNADGLAYRRLSSCILAELHRKIDAFDHRSSRET